MPNQHSTIPVVICLAVKSYRYIDGVVMAHTFCGAVATWQTTDGQYRCDGCVEGPATRLGRKGEKA